MEIEVGVGGAALQERQQLVQKPGGRLGERGTENWPVWQECGGDRQGAGTWRQIRLGLAGYIRNLSSAIGVIGNHLSGLVLSEEEEDLVRTLGVGWITVRGMSGRVAVGVCLAMESHRESS